MDEPWAPEPIATSRIEDQIWELKENYSIIMVTYSMQLAACVTQRTGFFFHSARAKVGKTG